MASRASSSSIISPVKNHSRYDVFISNNEDTRFSFTDHLYEALVGAGIRTFRDNPINTSEDLNSKIESVIKVSRASIVVLSKNYADSASCLDELLLIMERRRRFYHIVIPIFYHFDPKNIYASKVFQKGAEDKVEPWRVALMEVANLSPKVLSSSKPETKFIADLVNTIGSKLRLKLVSSPPHLTGMHTRAVDINFWVKDKQDAQVLVICGVAGSGKTTLAKYIYDSNLLKFENSSFLEDIGKICEQSYGLCALQEQLLSDMFEDKRKELDVTSYISRIEKALQKKRVLIVLDDIDKKEQIDALLGMEKINTNSKIIITSRLPDIHTWFRSRYHRCKEHRLELLNEHESLTLLSWYAFGSKIPMEGFKELALKGAQYCAGNPLALKLLGSLFVSARDSRKRNNIEYWMNTLNLSERDPDYRIQGILQMSFEYLPYITYRELFLHIACFFIGKDEDYVVKILEPDYCATAGIVTLINRCLLTVSPSKKLMMHGLFIEMARRIVHAESPGNPAEHSRVWCNEDAYHLLREGTGSETIEGLALDMRMVREEKHNKLCGEQMTLEGTLTKLLLQPVAFDADSLAKMYNLKLLQLNYVELCGSYDDFPEELRWLCWHGFPLGRLPSELFLGNLVAIDMSYSKLKLFEPPMVIRQLKILSLKDSHSLEEIQNISRLPNLETLILWNCYSLARISEAVGDLKSLSQLNMTGCENLFKLQQHLLTSSFPLSLQRLLLKNCNLDLNNHFLNFKDHSSLQYLNLSHNLFDLVPDYNHLNNLRALDLSFCSRLKCIERLPSTLEELIITCCDLLEKITFQSPRFSLREIDYQGCSNLVEIEGLLKLVPILQVDENLLGHLKWLKDYQTRQVCLIGDCHLTAGRSQHIQMLYEFGITSVFLPDIKDPNLICEYISESSLLSFDVPRSYNNNNNTNSHMLKGLTVNFKYSIVSGDEKDVWRIFAKISNTTKGRDWIYNPTVFGRPGFGEVGIWYSYWAMENLLDVGDKVNVCIIVEDGIQVMECGVSLVYDDDDDDDEMADGNNRAWDETLVGDLSAFALSPETYYMCRRNFFKSMEVDESIPIPDWFRDSIGYKIDYTGGWYGIPLEL